MKNIIILGLFLIGLSFASCNPMDDINKEVDAMKLEQRVKEGVENDYKKEREEAPADYTLTDEDYALSSNADVAKYKSFSAYALPKDYLPEILNKKFYAEDAFAMNITYKFYSKPIVDEDNAYTISEDEYYEMGRRTGYIGFDDEDHAETMIAKLLDRKVYAKEEGTEQTVEYNEYIKNLVRYITVNVDGSTTVLEDEPSEKHILDDNDYDDLGEGYGNFSWIADAEAGVVTLAGLRGHTLPQSYAVDVYRNFLPTYKVFYFNGSNWAVKSSTMDVTEPLNFALNNDDITQSTWWADPAIKITLTAEDYDSNTNTSKYDNFDLRGDIPPGTDRSKLVEMIGDMLELNHNPVDDQQYLVTYKYYDGGSGSATIRIIRTAGVWSEYTE